mgnify:CR=1 FL=1
MSQEEVDQYVQDMCKKFGISQSLFDKLKDTRYLEAGYRATAGILYCYDTHSTATSPLEKLIAIISFMMMILKKLIFIKKKVLNLCLLQAEI